MEKRGLRERLIKRIKEIYTKNAVRVNGKISGWFWTEKGIRQGCPLSPLLLALVIADIEEVLGKRQIGGIRIEKERT